MVEKVLMVIMALLAQAGFVFVMVFPLAKLGEAEDDLDIHANYNKKETKQ